MFGELVSLGGVRPRCPAPTTDSGGLASEEDRSILVGLRLNSRRIEAPIDEARLLLRVSSFFKGIKFGVDFRSRTTPGWCGTADNLSIVGGDLLDRGLLAMSVMNSLEVP